MKNTANLLSGCGRRLAALGLSVSLAAGGLLLSGCTHRLSMTVEAGDPLPDAVLLTAVDLSAYVDDVDKNCVNHPGVYELPIVDGNGEKYILMLTVKDTTRPRVTPSHVFCPQGKLPEAADFVGDIVEVDTWTAEFVGELPDLSALGDYDITFRVKDASGNATKELRSVVSVIRDTEAPIFSVVPELSATAGDAIAYRQGLVVTDNCCGELNVAVDSSAVNPNATGDYPVYYTATDASGNTSSAKTVIHIYSNAVTEEMLNTRIDEIIAKIIAPGMSKEKQLRKVYDYVRENVAYVSDSDKSDWIRAAYDSLFVKGSGDCFDYFAVAKAFCRRLGIDYREIQRKPGLTADTHYWLLVNVGTDDAPAWYHYDCTRLRDQEYIPGCLLTDKQVRAYSKVRKDFYAYDTKQYPASSTNIITKTPKLEAFY